MKRVLVTGGAGFLGSYVVDQLLAKGCAVMSFDCLMSQVHPQTPNWPEYQPDHPLLVKWNGDVRRADGVFSAALESFQPDTVIHLAALVGVGQSAYAPAQYTSCNVTGTAAVLNWILNWNQEQDDVDAALALLSTPNDGLVRDEDEPAEEFAHRLETARKIEAEQRSRVLARQRQRVERVFIAGSMSSYGEGAYRDTRLGDGDVRVPAGFVPGPDQWNPTDLEPMPTLECMDLLPASVYAWTKAAQEEIGLLIHRTRGLDVRIGRFFNSYGSRQSLTNSYTGAAAIFSARVAAGLAPVVFEDGEQSRDFIHASDVARAVIAILERGAPGEVYNVGTGRRTTVYDLALRICEAHAEANPGDEVLLPVLTGTRRVGDIRHCIADTTKLRALGWSPEVSLEDGLAELAAWVASQPAASAALLDRANDELEALGLVK